MTFAMDEQAAEFEDYALSNSSIADSFGEVEKTLKQIQVLRDNGKTTSLYNTLIEHAFDLTEIEVQSIPEDAGGHVEFLPFEGKIHCDAYAFEYEDEEDFNMDVEGEDDSPSLIP
jgi:hypothetical protein